MSVSVVPWPRLTRIAPEARSSGTRMAVLHRLKASDRLAGAAVISRMGVVAGVQEAHACHSKEAEEPNEKE